MWAEFELPELVLASASPRRAMLLRQVGLRFEVIVPRVKEDVPTGDDFDRVVVRNALSKALSVAPQSGGRAVISADTVVELDGAALGKPRDADQARAMLSKLSGRTHTVHSGLVLVDPARWLTYRDHSTTRVHFRNLRGEEIDAYIATGEPLDKAGAYGIQGRGALFIDRVEGCFFNVMGLPLAKLWEMLLRWQGEIRSGKPSA